MTAVNPAQTEEHLFELKWKVNLHRLYYISIFFLQFSMETSMSHELSYLFFNIFLSTIISTYIHILYYLNLKMNLLNLCTSSLILNIYLQSCLKILQPNGISVSIYFYFYIFCLSKMIFLSTHVTHDVYFQFNTNLWILIISFICLLWRLSLTPRAIISVE